jgi:hypothetical protein
LYRGYWQSGRGDMEGGGKDDISVQKSPNL